MICLQPSADFSPCTFGNQSFSSLESEIWRDISEYPTLSLSAVSPWSGRHMVLLRVFGGKTENFVFKVGIWVSICPSDNNIYIKKGSEF